MIPLKILTIALDAMPWLPLQLQTFNRLQTDWHWFIVEGAARNVACTDWCQPQEPRLSTDGTTQFLETLNNHPRITVIQRPSWDGKVEMCNAPLSLITEPCVLLQVDADEFHKPEAIDYAVNLFSADSELMRMQFRQRYFVGPSIIIEEEDPKPWVRAWRFAPGDTFSKHEPPTLAGNRGRCAVSSEPFDHFSYVLEPQVAAKEKFYGYKDAVAHWKRLQANTEWPVKNLTDFLPWAHKHSSATLFIGPATTAPTPVLEPIMPTLDEILNPNQSRAATSAQPASPPPNVTASQAYKNRAGPWPRPLMRRFLIVISFWDGDHEEAADLANLIHDLQKERSADTDIMFYHRHDARPMEPHTQEKMRTKFLRIYSHKCTRLNARGHPYGCNEMWYALVEMMRTQKWTQEYYAFFNMEPDCTPLTPDWIGKISAEFRHAEADGFAAVGHIKESPTRHLNGAAVYSTNFFARAGGMDLVGGSASISYDINHAKRILPVSVDTPLIGGRWGLTTIKDDELWRYTKDGGPVAVFHGAKDSSARDAVRRRHLGGK